MIMRYLLDTQILIWFQLNSKHLSPILYELLTDRKNQILVSDISLLEIAIKQKTGKLSEFPLNVGDIALVMDQDGFESLQLKKNHIAAYNHIPLFADHRDPFDRLLIATALVEELPIISADKNFKLYTPQIQLIET